MAQLNPHSLCHSSHRKTTWKPPPNLSVVVAGQHISGGTGWFQPVPLEIHTSSWKWNNSLLQLGPGEKKIKIKRANISYSGATSKMPRNSGMMVRLIIEALVSDSPLALSGFTPCSCDSRADPFQTQPLRSIVKERFLFVTVQHIQGPSHPHCKQIPSTQHHRPMGCNGSSQFTMQDAVEDWRKHIKKKKSGPELWQCTKVIAWLKGVVPYSLPVLQVTMSFLKRDRGAERWYSTFLFSGTELVCSGGSGGSF